jgi:hypothetical protein
MAGGEALACQTESGTERDVQCSTRVVHDVPVGADVQGMVPASRAAIWAAGQKQEKKKQRRTAARGRLFPTMQNAYSSESSRVEHGMAWRARAGQLIGSPPEKC